MAKLDELFSAAINVNASDIHIVAGEPVIIRHLGKLKKTDCAPLSMTKCREVVFELLSEPQKKEFEEKFQLDFVYEISGIGRFRGSVMQHQRGMSAVFRVIPPKIIPLDALGLPDTINEILDNHQGIILVTGATGQGKSTTLAAMIDYINENRSHHILTIEDPIEFVHPFKKGVVNQRQIGTGTLQVAVFGVLAKDRFALPVDVRLYLPKKWTDDPERCDKAGIPETARTFRTKEELALEIVAHARENDLHYAWVGADGGYGKGPGFCIALDRMGERFVVDLHSDFRVYVEKPNPYLPVSRKGRKFTRYRVDEKSIEVKDAVERMGLSVQPILEVRNTTRGILKMRALRIPVYIWENGDGMIHRYSLIATQTLGKNPETKISLSNAPETLDLKTIAWMQLQRFWVERAFEDAKSECGMADYQVRKWRAWHHHMALVMMAMLFMLNERIRHKDTYPLLSCSDIEELTYANALKSALRQDPDVIMIGELRDLETISMAITASETGHLVIGTLSTSSAHKTVERIIDSFPAKEQNQIRSMVSETLKGIITQRLVPAVDGSKMELALEILIGTLPMANLIRDEKTYQIPSMMQTKKKEGMILMDESLMMLMQDGKITAKDAMANANKPDRFKTYLDKTN